MPGPGRAVLRRLQYQAPGTPMNRKPVLNVPGSRLRSPGEGRGKESQKHSPPW